MGLKEPFKRAVIKQGLPIYPAFLPQAHGGNFWPEEQPGEVV